MGSNRRRHGGGGRRADIPTVVRRVTIERSVITWVLEALGFAVHHVAWPIPTGRADPIRSGTAGGRWPVGPHAWPHGAPHLRVVADGGRPERRRGGRREPSASRAGPGARHGGCWPPPWPRIGRGTSLYISGRPRDRGRRAPRSSAASRCSPAASPLRIPVVSERMRSENDQWRQAAHDCRAGAVPGDRPPGCWSTPTSTSMPCYASMFGAERLGRLHPGGSNER